MVWKFSVPAALKYFYSCMAEEGTAKAQHGKKLKHHFGKDLACALSALSKNFSYIASILRESATHFPQALPRY